MNARFEFGWRSAVKVNRRTGPDIDHRTSHGRPSSSLSPLLSREPRTDLIAPNMSPKASGCGYVSTPHGVLRYSRLPRTLPF